MLVEITAFLLDGISKFVLRALAVTVRVQTSVSVGTNVSSIGRSAQCIVSLRLVVSVSEVSQRPAFSVMGRGCMRRQFA
jgi:hypothetical protein